MKGFEKLMENFMETKYKSQIVRKEKMVSQDDAEDMFDYLGRLTKFSQFWWQSNRLWIQLLTKYAYESLKRMLYYKPYY